MNKWTFALIFIILFWSIALADSQVYAYVWVDGSPELNEQARFLNQVLGQDAGIKLAPAADAAIPPAYKLGDRRNFYAVKMESNGQYELEALARAVSDKSYIFVENGRSVTTSKIKSLSASFDRIYDTITGEFGNPPDSIDGDPRIYILILDILDRPQANGVRTFGYYSAINQYSNASLARRTNQRSNEVEMLYMDYTALNSLRQGESVLAHEFTHMVQWARDPDENSWINEGMAVYAESMLGYRVDDRISAFEKNADVSLLDWSGSIEDYGAAYLFFAYISERFGGVSSIKSIMSNRGNGTRGIERGLAGMGRSVSFQSIFSDWVIANYLDNPVLDDGIYGYRTLDISLAPYRVEALYPIANKKSRVKPWSARYIEFMKEQDDILSLTVRKDDGTDIVAQVIEFGNEIIVSPVKSGRIQSGTTIVPPAGRKAVLVVTSQPERLVLGDTYSDYDYSAEVEANVTPVEPTTHRKITTWGSLKNK